MATVTNEDFAREVKGDRLRNLYQFTLLFCAGAGILVFTFGYTLNRPDSIAGAILLSLFTLAIGCGITRMMLKYERVREAAWSYALGAIAATGVLLTNETAGLPQMIVFLLPVIVFLSGLLLAPGDTFLMATIATAVAILSPSILNIVNFTLEGTQVFAGFLIYLAAIFAVQVSGELYQITEWALSNYQRERRTNDELFEKRMALQRSLKRSEILGEKLLESNKELEVAYGAAEEAKQFRGQFLANMSHELRTPLNAIIGFSETMLKFPMMYDNQSLPNTYERDLSQIYDSGRQLLHVINDILDLAKVDAGKLEIHMQEVDIGPIIAAVNSTARGLIKGHPIMFEENLPDPLPKVWADESRLRQVLLNLYSNACKYTDEGKISLTVKEEDNKVIFNLKDTGIGIAPEFHEAIFEEFQQATNAGRDVRSGTGLGLPISKQLLHLMNGTIWLESEAGVGSTFSFAIEKYNGQGSENRTHQKTETVSASPITESKPVSHSRLPNVMQEVQQETAEV